MKRRFFLLLLFLAGVISIASCISILHFVDPYENKIFAVMLLGMSFIGAVVGILSILFYSIKKIYYRGDVTNIHIISSMRQSFFIGLSYILYVVLIYFSIPVWIPLLGIVLFFLSLELFLQSFYYLY